MARLDPLRRAIARSPTEIQTARPELYTFIQVFSKKKSGEVQHT